MKRFDIIIFNFPFSDFKKSKFRPALIWDIVGEDIVLLPLTTNSKNNFSSVKLLPSIENGLRQTSYIKVLNFFTIKKNLIAGKIGLLEKEYIGQLEIILCNKYCK